MTDFFVRRAASMFLLAILFLLLILALRPMVRDAGFPDELRYAPADASIVVMIPDPTNLAAKLHVHLCPFGEDLDEACFYRPHTPPEDGPLRQAFEEMLAGDDDNLIALFAPITDLIDAGIDPAKPILFSARGPLTGGDFVLVMSLQSEPTACLKLIEKLQEEYAFAATQDADECDLLPTSIANATDSETWDDLNIYFKRLDADRVAFFTNQAVFDSVWQSRREPNSMFNQDQIDLALKAIWGKERPALWGYARHTGIEVLSPSAFSISFDDVPASLAMSSERLLVAREALASSLRRDVQDLTETRFLEGGEALRLKLWFAPGRLSSSHIDGFFNDPTRSNAGFTDLGYGAGFSASADDMMKFMRFLDFATMGSIADYLFYERESPLRSFSRYGSVITAAETIHSIDAIDVQLAGFQDRIPELVVRISIAAQDAHHLVERMQLEEQTSRDKAVLRGARPDLAPEYWDNDCTSAQKSDEIRNMVESLAASGVLRLDQTPGRFSHLWCEDIRPELSGGLYEGCFSGAETCRGRDAYRYLQSPLNEDDFEHRFARSFDEDDIEGDMETAREELIENDRFRLVSTFDDIANTLWIASDASTLRRIAFTEGERVPVDDRINVRILPERVATLLVAQQFDQSDEDALFQLTQLFDELSVYSALNIEMHVPQNNEGVEIDVSFTR